jgi:hypothetical protein
MKLNYIKSRINFYTYKLKWVFIFLKKNREKKPFNEIYSIGVTTFLERYEILFKDLIKRLNFSFPGTEIIVAVNGHYNQEKQKEYLLQIEQYCKNFSSVKLIIYEKPQGLSKLWNRILISSTNNKIFLLNDDILFYPSIHKKIDSSGILKENISLINQSFSHFFINKSIIKEVGWFDERLLEIGGEDDDYHVRLTINNIELKNYLFKGLSNFKPKLKVNSYGNMVNAQIGGYSNSNTAFLLKKWDVRNKKFEGATFIYRSMGSYWKLKNGMETPNYYKNLKEGSEFTT